MARQTLGNGESGQIIRGKINDNFAELYSNHPIISGTKPLTRPGGSALVIGDEWKNSATGQTGRFNGTYFLSEPKFSSANTGLDTNTSFASYDLRGQIQHPPDKNLFIHSAFIGVYTKATNDNDNYWKFYLVPVYGNISADYILLESTANDPTNSSIKRRTVLNQFIDCGNYFGFVFLPEAIGSPTTLGARSNFGISYSEVME